MIDEPLGAFMYRSSIILDLSDSRIFHGLLLTILGSPSIFHGCRTPRGDYVSVINTHRFGLFWPISSTITQCIGVPKRFPRLMIPEDRLRVRRQYS